LVGLRVRRLVRYSANQDAATAISSDRTVIGTSYDIGIGVRSASMPIKCIDQIPLPMEAAPPANQKASDPFSWDATTRDVKSSAT
jgi:hypothetical protein